MPKLCLRELLALAKLLGCPSCGSKETVIIRLLAKRELRFKLARFTDNLEELANSYQRESLRDMLPTTFLPTRTVVLGVPLTFSTRGQVFDQAQNADLPIFRVLPS
jgi:hypothetical protein